MFRILILTLFGTIIASNSTSTEINPLSDEFINLINNEQSYWRAGRNFAEDTPLGYLKNLLGAIKSNDTVKLEVVSHPPEMLENLPDEFDPRSKWPNCPSLNHIRDQGSCGSCWAFGAVEAMTDRYCIFSNGTKQFYFSAQDLVSCCEECGYGCNGGNPSEAWNFWVQNGIVSGGDFNSKQGCRPYEIPACNHHTNNSNLPPCNSTLSPTPDCKPNCIDEYKTSYDSDKRHGKKAYLLNNDENNIKAELYHNGPVEASFNVYGDFLSYKSGVYIHKKGSFSGGHAVKLLGWGVEDNKKYWLVANSWNSNWGDKGYFKILRGNNECDIENGVVAGTPII